MLKKSWFVGLITLVPIAFISACSQQSRIDPIISQSPLKPGLNKNHPITSFSQQKFNIIDHNVDRKIVKDLYLSPINQKYDGKLNYPGWNYNYRQNPEQVINGTKINLQQTVMQEVSDYQKADGNFAKYNDPEFILNEIKNNQLKRHPAANNWFAQAIPDDLKAVNKSFHIDHLSGPTSLGLYVAPGEVATLKFGDKTLKQLIEQNIDDLEIVINNSFWDNLDGQDESGRISNRYPFVRTYFKIDLEQLMINNGQFQFGSPFGGTISFKVNQKRIKSDHYDRFYGGYDGFDFTIKGALATLEYNHGLTNWNQEITNIKKLKVPAISINLPFASTYIQSTAMKQFAHLDLEQIRINPTKMQKWVDFLTISNYFASRDIGQNYVKLDMQFNDDVWGGAIAWGGGNRLHADLNQAKSSFLSDDLEWKIADNWGLFHEINHNFQQDEALFIKRDHPETNFVSMINLALLSDSGRWRNLFNISSNFTFNNWSEFQNNFSVISRKIIANNYGPRFEYELQNLLIGQFGALNMINYVRDDMKNRPSTGGFSEIVELSDFFKVNLWPALRDFSSIYNDGWPDADAKLDVKQKAIVDRLNRDYQAIDFVANCFASGIYLPDGSYSGDLQAPIAIDAFSNYEFDFEKAIVSANPNWKWDHLEVNPTSKLGAKLVQNEKKITYIPKSNTLNQSDEFDVVIKGLKSTSSDVNYVDSYRWKIKVDLVANLPEVQLFNDQGKLLFKGLSPVNKGIVGDWTVGVQPLRLKIKFKFLAPISGLINWKWNADAPVIKSLKINNHLINNNQYHFEKNQIYDFEIETTSRWNAGQKLEWILNDHLNGWENVFSPNWNGNEFDDKLLSDPYQSRQLDRLAINNQLMPIVANRKMRWIDKNFYQFSSLKVDDADLKLGFENDGTWYEGWADQSPYQDTITVDFNHEITLKTIYIKHYEGAWQEGRPTWLTIKNQADQIIYDQVYLNRQQSGSLIQLEQAVQTTQLKFYFKNEADRMLLIDSILFSSDELLTPSTLIAINDPIVEIVGNNWAMIKSDQFTINHQALWLKAKANGIRLQIPLGITGFDLIGSAKNDVQPKWILKINGNIVNDWETKGLNEQILFSYNFEKPLDQVVVIELINQGESELYLEGVQFYH